MGILLQAFRLAKKQELCKANLIDLARQLASRTLQSRREPSDQLGWPFEVIGVVVPNLKRSEQSVIFQPMPMRVAELLIVGLQFPERPGAEVDPSLLEDESLERNDSAIIDWSCRRRFCLTVARLQQSVLNQIIRAD